MNIPAADSIDRHGKLPVFQCGSDGVGVPRRDAKRNVVDASDDANGILRWIRVEWITPLG